MNEKIISNGFVRNYEGPWINLREIIQFSIQKTEIGKFRIFALTEGTVDFYISGDMNSQNEAQSALDYMMLQ